MKNPVKKLNASILRKKAEGSLKKKRSNKAAKISEVDILKLIHELEVHQIELEMQNEELIQANRRIEEDASEKYIELYDFAPSGYFTLSDKGEIFELNLYGSQMLGKERSLIKNSLFGFFVSNDTKPIFNLFLRKVFNSKTKQTCEVDLVTYNNLSIHVYITGIFTKNEKLCHITVIDITKRKLAENDLIKAKEKAEESDKLKSAFLQNMSHEIRTPMNAIIGFSKILEKPDLSQDKRKIYTDMIINSANQLLLIVNDTLTISSIETKQENVNITKVCINNIIADLYTIFKKQAIKKNLSIYTKQKLSDKQSEIYTDKIKVTQILTNLIQNALKFTHEGFIEFGYKLIDNKLEFYVKDSGIGIKTEMHDIIFERFRQADEKVNKTYGGTGLGLSISKAFSELLGGKIWVKSELNKGSIFYFTIPYKPVYGSDKHHSKTNQVKNKTTILIAEDDANNYQYLKELLIGMNLQLIHTLNGKETVEICKVNSNIDLILMDIKMPVLSGDTAAKMIKEFRPNLPIIAQSAYTSDYKIKKSEEKIFDDYITKPIKKTILKHKVMKYIDKQI